VCPGARVPGAQRAAAVAAAAATPLSTSRVPGRELPLPVGRYAAVRLEEWLAVWLQKVDFLEGKSPIIIQNISKNLFQWAGIPCKDNRHQQS